MIQGITAIRIPSKATSHALADQKNKTTIFILAAFDDASHVSEANSIAAIESIKTGEIRIFMDDTFLFGRANPWTSGAMSAGCIGREHADIQLKDGVYWLNDHSKNGTLVNGVKYNNAQAELHDGDMLTVQGNSREQIPSESFLLHLVSFQGRQT